VAAPRTSRPVLSPAGGAYATAQIVKLTAPSKGSKIYYTVDGSTPTHDSTRYTYPIEVAASVTIRCVAKAWNRSLSEVAIASYVIGGVPEPARLTYPVTFPVRPR
jgi:hypothetical protein